MIAIVMAGGRASRFANRVEKAVLDVGGRTLLERSLSALDDSRIEEIMVAVTKRVPETKKLARELGASVIETAGTNYHEDVLQLLEAHSRFLSLNVDVPFIRSNHLRGLGGDDKSISEALVVPFETSLMKPDEASTLRDSLGRRLVWVGLNWVTKSEDMHLKIVDDPFLTVNINNESDLAFARKLAEDYNL